MNRMSNLTKNDDFYIIEDDVKIGFHSPGQNVDETGIIRW